MIYFDNASTTKPFSKVLDLYLDSCNNYFYNPHSIHFKAMEVDNLILKEKNKILNLLKLKNSDYDIIFTSGATESNNLALLYYKDNYKKFDFLLTSKLEHSSVNKYLESLDHNIFNIEYVKYNEDKEIDLIDLKEKVKDKKIFLSLMSVNNEVGLINPLNKIKEIINQESLIMCDNVQGIAKYNFDLSICDFIVISGHKIHGLKGIGALIYKKKLNLKPLIYGGGQQNNIRSGTLDYPLILSLRYALELSLNKNNESLTNIKEIQDYLFNELNNIEGIKIHKFKSMSPYIVNFSLVNKKASVVVEALSNDDIFVNSVSACNSKTVAYSYVLKELSYNENECKNPIRLSLSYDNTLEEAKIFIEKLKFILNNVRS